MLTRAPIGQESNLDNDQRWAALIVALFLFGVLGSVLVNTYHRVHVVPTSVQRTADVSLSIFSTYVIPFEVVSVVLLAALVGAVVIARRD
jgi:NADH-quinone oxidoreductase subunit J